MKLLKTQLKPIAHSALGLAAFTALAAAWPALAQETSHESVLAGTPFMLEAEGRGLVALRSGGSSADRLGAAPRGYAAHSFEAGSRRIHVVTFEGETYRAAVPLDGPRSWVAFDPDRRAFASLLPSVRIELKPGLQIDAIASAIGATGATVFESLGFGILDLPGDLHPADAVARIQGLPGEPDAAVRLRGPRIEWR